MTASVVIGAGSVQFLHSVKAATGPAVYNVYEPDVKDEAAYTAALSKKLAAPASLAVSTKPNRIAL